MPFRLPNTSINWVTSSFLIGTAFLAVTAVPYYIWRFGLDPFLITMFFVFSFATGLSITLGYHRLFSHLSFKAKWPVRLFTALFGAAAFENSVLDWAHDHRKHHKHVDHDDDPYDISKGFWYAHIGWLLFRVNIEPPRDGVPDLEKDRILVFQDRYYVPLAFGMGFVLPTVIGALHNGWVGALGGFLILGVARIVAVQQSTFFINSLCHTIGERPYSSKCSARDSWLMALFTFGEGYHNYHHEFQHDYRNGVKWWQWDPTKWTIWTLEKLGMASGLRRVPEEKILLSQMAEARRLLDARLACEVRPLSDRMREMLETSHTALEQVGQRWATLRAEYANKADVQIERAREVLAEMRRELRQAMALLERAGAPA